MRPKYSFLEAAYHILQKTGRPMTAAEILYEGRLDGSISTRGKTPLKSLNARLAVDILKLKSLSRFRRFTIGEKGFLADAKFESIIEMRSRLAESDNPFSYWERLQIIRRVIGMSPLAGRYIEIVPFGWEPPLCLTRFDVTDHCVAEI